MAKNLTSFSPKDDMVMKYLVSLHADVTPGVICVLGQFPFERGGTSTESEVVIYKPMWSILVDNTIYQSKSIPS
ncbi:MAG: hypothetical protein R2795_24745 [Saprospiraceae bacterium]